MWAFSSVVAPGRGCGGSGRGQAAEAVVAAEFDDHDFRVQEQDGAEAGDGVLGGGAAGALVDDFVVVAAGVEVAAAGSRDRMAGLEAVAGGDAVAEADQDGEGSPQRAGGQREADRLKQRACGITYTWIV
jgi:hypothetical protein